MTQTELQDLIDTQNYVELPAGVIDLNSPLTIGREGQLSRIVVRGAGSAHAGEQTYGGTFLRALYDDGPVVNFVGSRGSSLSGVSIIGPHYNPWVYPGPDRSLWPQGDQCGIGIDYYGNPNSCSGVWVDDVSVNGCCVGLLIQPRSDAQGDFVNLRRVSFFGCTDAISVCQTQNRLLQVDQAIEVLYCHTFLTNNTHGAKSGNIQGRITGASFNKIERLCDITMGGVTVFDKCYGELIGSFGRFYDGSARRSVPVKFRDCEFRFDTTGVLAREGSLTLEGGSIEIPGAAAVIQSRHRINGTLIIPRFYEDQAEYSVGYKKFANATRGVVGMLWDPDPLPRDGNTAAYFQDDIQVAKWGEYERPMVIWADKVHGLPNVSEGATIQDPDTMTTWVVSDGAPTRINNHDVEIGTSGYYYHTV